MASGTWGDPNVYTKAETDAAIQQSAAKFTTAYSFSGTVDSEGLIVSNLPLDGYVPVGVTARSQTRDGWSYTFIKYGAKNNTYWTIKINGGSGDYAGTILAYKL